jgi:hypothetical protein
MGPVLLAHLATALMVPSARSLAVHPRSSVSMNFFSRLLEEMDNFADDAVNRRLGNGAKFYGKRKSSFYGEDDENRKADPSVASDEEDFRGPQGGSFCEVPPQNLHRPLRAQPRLTTYRSCDCADVLSKERDEQGRPMGFLTRGEARRLKEQEEQEVWDALRREQQKEELRSRVSESLSTREDEEA